MWSITRILKYGFTGFTALLVGTTLGLTKAEAQTPSNSQEPGSVIIFPYFASGTLTVDKTVLPRTEIHIGVTCPPGVSCFEGEPIKLMAHWVCPGSENPVASFVCKESDFVLFTTVNGKITLDPNGHASGGNFTNVPPCKEGYLIAWAINAADQPIKFDGLFGDVVVRSGPGGSAESAYRGVTVQAADTNPVDTGALITTGVDPFTLQPMLIFDGLNSDYATLTGQLTGDVKFTNEHAPLFSNTKLVLLTVDVQSGFPNNPTFVPITFFNANQQPTSTETNFVCWQIVQITSLDGSLNQTSQTTPEGSFVTDQATKVQIAGVNDSSGPATLLGLVITMEGDAPNITDREYIIEPYNNSVPIPTTFAF